MKTNKRMYRKMTLDEINTRISDIRFKQTVYKEIVHQTCKQAELEENSKRALALIDVSISLVDRVSKLDSQCKELVLIKNRKEIWQTFKQLMKTHRK